MYAVGGERGGKKKKSGRVIRKRKEKEKGTDNSPGREGRKILEGGTSVGTKKVKTEVD